MTQPASAIESVDVEWFRQALAAGIHRVVSRRDYINKINVFPVPDSDTGTNLAFTMHAIAAASERQLEHIGQFLARIADHALDGARGNSGAIFAQYLQGFSEAAEGREVLTASSFAEAAWSGSQSAQAAIAQPREGTMLSVIRDHAAALREQISGGVTDVKTVLQHGLESARRSLERTPEQLEVLREAGVVDAGGQGFVDWLEGIQEYAETGVAKVVEAFEAIDEPDIDVGHQVGEQPQHRFCTECVVTGSGIDRNVLRDELTALDSSSLVIAGTKNKVRVHIHVNNPAEAFVVCEDFGSVTSQKADDMLRQTTAAHGVKQTVAVVTDTAADIPEEELERLDLHVIPLRINFGDRQYLDKVSLAPGEFYRLMGSETDHPRTSQPPAGDYRRLFEFLGSHYSEVLSLSVSSALSGTWQAAQSATQRTEKDIIAWDSMNAACGQGLLTMYAAEAAQRGFVREEILAMLDHLKEQTKTYAVLKELTSAVRGGRLSARVKSIADWLRLTPVLGTHEGRLKPRGALLGRARMVERFAHWLHKRQRSMQGVRLMVAHCDAQKSALMLRDELVKRLGSVHSAYVAEAGPAIGAHAGPGSLIVGIQPYTAPDDLAEELFGVAINDDDD